MKVKVKVNLKVNLNLKQMIKTFMRTPALYREIDMVLQATVIGAIKISVEQQNKKIK